MPKHLLFARALAILSTGLLISLPVLAADDGMKVTDNEYLDTRGFSVILYQSTTIRSSSIRRIPRWSSFSTANASPPMVMCG